MKRMLINATQQEELRVALVEGQYLYDLDIESPGHEQKKANIYKGTIVKINPSLEAAFVSYGGERDGFLSLKEIADNYFPANLSGRKSIKHLKEGQEVLVQIEKEIRGKKGAALTTYISLAGSYLVLMPNDPKAGGVSRRIEGEDRADLKRIIDALDKPKGMGVIARTAGVGKSQEELQQDLDALLTYWNAIQTEAKNHPAPILIHKESDIITRAFRDYLRDDVGEIIIDNKQILEIAKKRLVGLGRTEYLNRLKLYSGDVPLFSRLQIETQIESAFQREVRLPSGGSIVIDTTEALTAIDINSAKSIRGSDIEETAFNTNLEAAEEIARQLRLRDLGGLIVIDFIDMTPIRNQREVENRLKEAMKNDRARIQTTRISRFGLLEMSRQRLSPSLKEATHHICPRCSGTGTVRDNNSLSLSILRIINEEALKENTGQIDVIVPIPIASYLLNEKRRAIAKIEKENPGLKIVIAADKEMETPQYKVIRKRQGEEIDVLSYNLPKLIRELEEEDEEIQPELVIEKAILSGVTIDPKQTSTKAPKEKPKTKETAPKKGLFASLLTGLSRLFSASKTPVESNKKTAQSNQKSTRQTDKRRNNRRNRNSSTETVRENKASRRSQTNSDKANSNAAKVKTVEVIDKNKTPEKAIVTEKRDPKPRRAQRTLTKSVRVNQHNQVESHHDNKVSDIVDTATQTALLPLAIPETQSETNTQEPMAPSSAFSVETMPSYDVKEDKSNTISMAKESVTENTTTDNNSDMRRSRRTPRHLRMNGQRRKRLKEASLAESPMPLAMAVASPELALGKVCIDYSLIHHHQNSESIVLEQPPVNANKMVSEQDENSLINQNDSMSLVTEVATETSIETSVTTTTSLSPVTEVTTMVTPVEIVVDTIEHDVTNNEAVTTIENPLNQVEVNLGNQPNVMMAQSSEQWAQGTNHSKQDESPSPALTNIEPSLSVEPVIESVPSMQEILPLNQDTVVEIVEQPLIHCRQTHAYAGMTKAPATNTPINSVEDVVLVTHLSDSNYQFTGKGYAGGHSADSHAYAAMSKPQTSEQNQH
jgi:ribonuclease E